MADLTEHKVGNLLYAFLFRRHKMFYMVNPSKLNKKKLNRNPELLIVNPFEGTGSPGHIKEEKKMASKKRRMARRNPTVVETAKKVVQLDTFKQAALLGIGGGAATAFGAAVVGRRFGESAFAPVAVATVGGILGAVVLDQLGERMNQPMLSQAAMPVAIGALALSIWELGRDPVLSTIDSLRVAVGLAPKPPVLVPVAPPTVNGMGSDWEQEFSGLGQSYSDETKTGVGLKGYESFGVVTADTAGQDNPFKKAGLSGYEPLGDIYGNQRLGSFEAEGFGSFTPEEANWRDQQVADKMKSDAGVYGSKKKLSGYGELADAFGTSVDAVFPPLGS